ncbi:MAG: wax ester/triacylglycerol synthase domain-containing protein [Acidimicrobiales bacterium]
MSVLASASERMSATDQLLWIGDRHPDLRSTVVSVAIIDGTPSRQDLADRWERMARAVERLRQRVCASPVSIAPPRWEPDADFDINNHLRWAPELATPRTMRDVLDIAAAKASEPFPTDRPLWEVTAVPALPDGQFALVQKFHHAITDGINAVRMQLELFDFEAHPAPVDATPVPDDPPPGQAGGVGDAIRWDLRRRMDALAMARKGADELRRHPASSLKGAAETGTSLARVGQLASAPLSALMTGREDRRRFDTLTLPLGRAKQAGRSAGTKLNAVFLAGLSVGLRRYHDHHQTPQAQLRLGIPISTRTDETTTNAFVGTRFGFPLVYEDLPSHLRTLERLVKTNATERALTVLPALSAQIARLPEPAATRVFRRLLAGTDVQASNVPGSPLPMFLAGHPLLHQFAFGPTTTAALNVTLLSYVDALDIAVASNTGAIPDPEVLLQSLEEGFGEVLELADR